MATLGIEKVWKYYGDTIAVRDLTMDCQDGEFVCVLGPSGCGKSSTMRMIAGLEHITSGDIFLGDRRINDLAPKDRDIAMVFENYALYPHKTVAENIGNPLRLAKLPRAEIDKRVLEAAKLLEIDTLLNRNPAELSGGQKQRVAIGRVIVRRPQIYLFDEPIAHLDAKLRARMRSELKHLQKQQGVTTVYVTHDQLEALSMADRIAVMHEGVLQQFDTPSEIYLNPVNAWVAGFVGEPAMNLTLCELQQIDGKVNLVHAGFSIQLNDRLSQAALACKDNQLRLGVRPENLNISASASEGAIEGEVYSRQLLGSDLLIDVISGGDHIRVRTHANFSLNIGEKCYVAFDLDHTHLFSHSDGNAII